jgi:hypothetical protein
MKRIKTTIVVPSGDEYMTRESLIWIVKGVGEVEKYEEKEISKEEDFLTAHHTDRLWDAALDFADGLWLATKGLWGMSKYAMILLITGLRWLWSNGIGMALKSEKEEELKNKKGVHR